MKELTVRMLPSGDVEITVPDHLDMDMQDVILLLTLAEMKAKLAYLGGIVSDPEPTT